MNNAELQIYLESWQNDTPGRRAALREIQRREDQKQEDEKKDRKQQRNIAIIALFVSLIGILITVFQCEHSSMPSRNTSAQQSDSTQASKSTTPQKSEK